MFKAHTADLVFVSGDGTISETLPISGAWRGPAPTTELDVRPSRIEIRVSPGGTALFHVGEDGTEKMSIDPDGWKFGVPPAPPDSDDLQRMYEIMFDIQQMLGEQLADEVWRVISHRFPNITWDTNKWKFTPTPCPCGIAIDTISG